MHDRRSHGNRQDKIRKKEHNGHISHPFSVDRVAFTYDSYEPQFEHIAIDMVRWMCPGPVRVVISRALDKARQRQSRLKADLLEIVTGVKFIYGSLPVINSNG